MFDAAVHLQGKTDFNSWIADENLDREYQDFLAYLEENNVLDVVEPWQLMRQGTDWEEEGHPPFAMAPRDKWHEILPTLELIRDDIIPEIDEVRQRVRRHILP